MNYDSMFALLSKEQTADLLAHCAEYLEVDAVERALRRGLTDLERRQLAFQLSIEFDRL